MCGIAGFLPDAPAIPERSTIEAMCDRLAHRGPDGQGCFLDEGIALGHRRLSIIDLAGGAQPLGNEDNSVQVVFNGEIYNFPELRAGLIKNGHKFKTRTDTEVLVHLYEEVGDRLPEHLNGMFAFAIWDGRRRELFLARDRFGEKPLYYSFDLSGYRFCFASELKALTALDSFDRPTSARSVADFLCLSYIPDPQTIYEGVHKLEAGRSLTVAASTHRIRRYWQPEFLPGDLSNPGEAAGELEALAGDAVKIRMISDVPLGAFLSGGVDSSAAVAFMKEAAPDHVRTFSIGFTVKKFDELSYARSVARHLGTRHEDKVVTPEIHEILDKLLLHYDEPFADSSAIPMLYLSRMTRGFVTVALSGDGTDELFGGYRRYYYGLLEERIRRKFPGWFRRSFFRYGGKYYPKLDFLPQIFRAKSLLTNLSQELGDAYFSSMTAFRDEGLRAVLAPELRSRLGSYDPRESFRNRFLPHSHLPPLEQIQAVDLETYLPGDILVKTDRATMAYSLEGRAPWLDHRIGELAFRLPAELKMNGRQGKHLFKTMIAPRLPREVVWRPKMGFSVPLAHWFRSSLVETFEQRVLRANMERYLQLEEVRRLWRQHQSGVSNHSRKLWAVLMLASWAAGAVGRRAG